MELPLETLAGARCLGVLESPADLGELSDVAIRVALTQTVVSEARRGSVGDWVEPGTRVCLVVSDHTRRTAADRVLPVLLSVWAEHGCGPGQVEILFASGIHRPPTADEVAAILGREWAARLADRIHFHDAACAADCVEVGRAPDGWPVRINRRAVEADRLVLLGAATYHYHAGFGGGRKSLVPGIAAGDLIAHSHSLTLDPVIDRIDPRVEIGRLDGNPVAEYLLACARVCPSAHVVNTVVDSGGRLVGVFAGELDAAHRAACRQVEAVDGIRLAESADLVIASAGSAGNWIQSHKALFNASRAVRPGGRIVLVAPCREGLGNERFRHWVTQPDMAAIYGGLRQSPEVLGQTALSTRLRGAATVLVTDLSGPDRVDLGIRVAPTLADAIRLARQDLPESITYYVMPHALHTVPFVGA